MQSDMVRTLVVQLIVATGLASVVTAASSVKVEPLVGEGVWL